VLASLFAAALTTPLGMLASYPIVSRIDPAMLAALLAISAGALIYVAASHLLPTAEREPQRYSLLALAAGVALAAGIVATHG
jgi:ZIP family zinc transporter